MGKYHAVHFGTQQGKREQKTKITSNKSIEKPNGVIYKSSRAFSTKIKGNTLQDAGVLYYKQ